ncbi:hypothetical protein FACS1894186_0400 [Alphaproteobacteria bacterium]|nr:hypothetical protein FACS1894186_0400 [Alphaproteobacteria bacterium]
MRGRLFIAALSLAALSACARPPRFRFIEPDPPPGVAGDYLGAPYLAAPLGDGDSDPYAPGPLWRNDAFDCTTYVETVLAERRAGEALENMRKIRYGDAKPDFFARNHFTETQWIPSAMRQGFIAPLDLPDTAASHIGGNLAVFYLQNPFVAEAVRQSDSFRAKAKQGRPFKGSIAYVPREAITYGLVRRLPESVAFFLKCPEKPTERWQIGGGQKFVTHMGLLKDGWLTHASSDKGKVVRVDFLDYLDDSSFCGAAFYKILD